MTTELKIKALNEVFYGRPGNKDDYEVFMNILNSDDEDRYDELDNLFVMNDKYSSYSWSALGYILEIKCEELKDIPDYPNDKKIVADIKMSAHYKKTVAEEVYRIEVTKEELEKLKIHYISRASKEQIENLVFEHGNCISSVVTNYQEMTSSDILEVNENEIDENEDTEICSVCKKVCTIEDECYCDHDTGEPCCTDCCFFDEADDVYRKGTKVQYGLKKFAEEGTCPYCGEQDHYINNEYEDCGSYFKEAQCCECNKEWTIRLSEDKIFSKADENGEFEEYYIANETEDMLSGENKQFGLFLKQLGYSQEDISNIANGSFEEILRNKKGVENV